MSNKNSLLFPDLKLTLRAAVIVLVAIAVFVLETAQEYILPLAQNIVAQPQLGEVTSLQPLAVNLTTWLAFMVLVSAATYFVLSTSGFGWYISSLKHDRNHMRWLHHAVSTSLMVVLTAMLSGINDVLTLMLIFLLWVIFTMLGYLMEKYNERRKRVVWYAYKVGVSTMVVAWLILVSVFLFGRWSLDLAVPHYLLGIYVLVTGFLAFFSLNMYLHYKKIGPWGDFVFDEKSYIAIDVIAKAAFIGLVYVGLLQ